MVVTVITTGPVTAPIAIQSPVLRKGPPNGPAPIRSDQKLMPANTRP